MPRKGAQRHVQSGVVRTKQADDEAILDTASRKALRKQSVSHTQGDTARGSPRLHTRHTTGSNAAAVTAPLPDEDALANDDITLVSQRRRKLRAHASSTGSAADLQLSPSSPQQHVERRHSISGISGGSAAAAAAAAASSAAEKPLAMPQRVRHHAPSAPGWEGEAPSTRLRRGSVGGGKQQRRGGSGSMSLGGNAPKPSLLASRVFKTDAMPFSLQESLEKHPFRWADPDLARTHITRVWEHYDENYDGVLQPAELRKLAADVVRRLTELTRDQLRGENPTASEKTLDGMLAKELRHVLPGGDGGAGSSGANTNVSRDERAAAAVFAQLSRDLDLDHDGKVTRTEFLFQWRVTAAELMNKPRQPKGGELACIIL